MEKIAPYSSDNTPEPPQDRLIEGKPSQEDVPFEYTILKGHFEPDHETWQSDEKLRMEYLELTDELVRKMLEEKEFFNPETGESEMRRTSVVIFLDKSARPLSHLVRAMWPTFAKDPETGETPPMPRFNFLNVDREQWTNTTNKQGMGRVDIDQISPDIIRSLRATALTSVGREQVVEDGGITDAVDTLATTMDNESILVVDETRSTGRTLKIATGMIQRAFPTAEVQGAHWMSKTFHLRDGREFNGIPNWYSETEVKGRGVGDRYSNYTKYQRLGKLSLENYYPSLGSLFLSAPLPEKDEKYYQLIREFKELAKNRTMPIMPSKFREDSDFEARIITYNYPDIDINQIDEEQKESLRSEVFDRIAAINLASFQEGQRMRQTATRPKRRR